MRTIQVLLKERNTLIIITREVVSMQGEKDVVDKPVGIRRVTHFVTCLCKTSQKSRKECVDLVQNINSICYAILFLRDKG